MSQVAVNKVNDASKATLSIFEEIAKRFETVRQRAFDLFEKRGGELGHDREDWLKAEREIFCPAAELAEKDGSYEMQISLPGFETKDVEVTLLRQLRSSSTRQRKRRKAHKRAMCCGPSLVPTTSIGVSKCRTPSMSIKSQQRLRTAS